MSNYKRQFPKSLPAAYVRIKESRFQSFLRHDIVPSYQDALQPEQIDRTIWLYWAQGWEAAPEIVKRCAASWENLNHGWTIVHLDDDNLENYISLDNVPHDINRTKQSNIWRLRLLEKYGGFWADATVLCMVPIETWLPFALAPTGSFVFKTPTSDRPFASWLIAAQRGSYLVSRFRAVYEKYINEYGDFHVFALHYIFDYLRRSDRRFAKEFKRIPSISANPSLAFGRWLSDPNKWPEPRALGVIAHKLSWKLPISMSELDAFLEGHPIRPTSSLPRKL